MRKVGDVYPICIVIACHFLRPTPEGNMLIFGVMPAFLGGHTWVEERLVLWVSSEWTQSLRLSPEKLLDQKRVGLDGLSPELDPETLKMCTATQRAGWNRMKLKRNVYRSAFWQSTLEMHSVLENRPVCWFCILAWVKHWIKGLCKLTVPSPGYLFVKI